ncbi:MAG: acyl-CoA reductase [Bacteroidia bacterium]|nr:acyl-CoA reductase [Bacteroidia bacterium]
MKIGKKIKAFEKLGIAFKLATEEDTSNQFSKRLIENARTVHIYNGWFTEENIRCSYRSFARMLESENLKKWLKRYDMKEIAPQNIGIIMAGNIPLVGFHDMLCALISGHKVTIKASGNDAVLPKLISEILIDIEPEFRSVIKFTENRLVSIDAIIATGSNNSARYFEYYFNRLPHIIRKNRNSIAILDGTETADELKCLGKDIFQYFGLGCRNVSKIFVPKNYNFDGLFQAIYHYRNVLHNNKYCNNYDYNKTVYLMSGIKLIENGFLLLKEDIGLASPVAVLFYEYYKNETELMERINMDAPHIQCIVSKIKKINNTLTFGQTQSPELWDYADGVDTMEFLINL